MKTYRKPSELFSQKVATQLHKFNKNYINVHKAQTTPTASTVVLLYTNINTRNK